ncbi:SusC/RagA family TonB-linked outer membrane protein [Segetibacter koreensis]|uniref:SusC/RagA family TonB-linked outer membrane protein n=1 Tax=Segetibacter koreensis TaxID=398037 RepID=UPI000376EA57|nr:TonB-dependent receptor [Segetibacter koreensis]
MKRHFTNVKNNFTTFHITFILIASLLLFFSNIVIAQQSAVSGTVTGENGNPLNAVSVSVKGSTRGTSTDSSGKFSILAPSNATLVFSSVGYTPQEVKVAGKSDVTVSLVSSNRELEQVVVIGYGTANKRDLTGSIARVSGKDIADKPNTNPVASLQGSVAGLTVVNNGQPGKEPDIRIRGTVSIGSVRPLYVVDGVFNDNIDYLNPNDIESIEILKDPSSLAIFGVRGAPGVIAVTTKKAKAGQVTINFNTSYSIKKLVDKIKLTNADEFKTLYNEQKANEAADNGGTYTPFDFSKYTGNTDWINALTQTANQSINNLSVAASSEKNRFYMAVGYTSDEGITRKELLQRITLTVNDEYKINKAIKIGFNFTGARQHLPYDQTGDPGNPLSGARYMLPINEPFDTKTGLYNIMPNTLQTSQANPLMEINNYADRIKHYENRIVGSVFAEINFLKNFTLRTTLYGDISNGDRTRYFPIIKVHDPLTDAVYVDPSNNYTRLSVDDYRTNKYQQDHILTYKKGFGGHNFTATAGWTTYYQAEFHHIGVVSQKIGADPIPDDQRFWYLSNGFEDPSSSKATSNQFERATASALFRVLYNYQNKYYLNASFRRDGSSIISPSQRYQNFYAVGAAWELTKEKFMSNQNLFDYLKIKGSWGVLGNQNTYSYNYPFYPGLISGAGAVFGGNVFPVYSQEYLPDPNLKWETVNSKEAGFELNSFKNRLHFEAVYYNKRTDGLLAIVPGTSGQPNGLRNQGSISNQGFEFTAGWTQAVSRDLNFNVNANLATIKNKVISLSTEGYAIYPEGTEVAPTKIAAGLPVGAFYGFVREGIYQTQDEIDKSPKVTTGGWTPKPGDQKFKDVNGNGVIDDSDRTLIGNPTPKFTYGASFSVSYKGFDLGVTINGAYGNQIYRVWGVSEHLFNQYNYPASQLNRWHGPGTSNTVPILATTRDINFKGVSTLGIESGSYWRIRNLQLGYNFSQGIISRAHIKSLRVFVNAQNLKTFKHNSGYTPEFGGSAIDFGLDTGGGAIPAVFTGGINVTF